MSATLNKKVCCIIVLNSGRVRGLLTRRIEGAELIFRVRDSSDICDAFGVAVITNLALFYNAFGVGIVTHLNMVRLQCI